MALASPPPPRVSVVLPTYNRRQTLGAAIESVRRQSFTDWELLLVDDGSSDGTTTWAEGLNEPRLRLIALERNRGAAAARNAGISSARGAYVAFLDSDDAWTPDKLSRQIAALDAAPEFGVSCTGVHLHLLDHGVTRLLRPRQPSNWAEALALGCELSPGSTQVTRRREFERVGLMDETLPRFEDWDWLFRYTRDAEILLLPEPFAHVYHRRGRMGEAVALSTERYFAKHAAAYAALPAQLRRKAVADAWLQVVANYGFEGRYAAAFPPFLRAARLRPLVSVLRAGRGLAYALRGRLLRAVSGARRA